MPSGDDPMVDTGFPSASKHGRAFARRSGSNNKLARDGIHPEPVALWCDYLAYRDLISRQRAARSPVKASRRSSIGQALPR
ncbi:hypothetical protein ACVWVY_006904 [Bradyrhizobium sp. URHC0002]